MCALILALDPGTEKTAYVLFDSKAGRLVEQAIVKNDALRDELRFGTLKFDHAYIEMIACYGMPVGKETFETCVWIGRFMEHILKSCPVSFAYRKDIKLHLCNSVRAKDGNVRQALIDKYGPPGTKKSPGSLYGISSHLWAALAVADYAASKIKRYEC